MRRNPPKFLLMVCAIATLCFLPIIVQAQLVTSGGKTIISQGGNDAQVLTSAPGSDTGQAAIAVRIISSLAGGAGGTSSSFTSAFPASGTAAGFSDGTNMQGARVVDLDTGAGTQYGLITNLVRRASGGSTEMIGQTTMANSLPVTFASDQSALSIAANSSVNLSQVAGTTTSTGNGVVGAGVQRVAIASDNTAFSVNNTQQGTASQNVAQINGVTPLMGNGVTGTGSQRVTIASDNTAFAVNNTQQGTASQNVAQIGATSVLTGNGVTGAGSQRVTIASDNTAFNVNSVQSGTWNVGISSGTNLIGKVAKATTCGTTAFDSGLTENVATGAGTDLTATATCVEALFVTNTTSSPVNLTIKDKSGTPKSYVTTFSLPANSNITFPLWGMKFTGGITVVSGTSSALNAQVVGYQ